MAFVEGDLVRTMEPMTVGIVDEYIHIPRDTLARVVEIDIPIVAIRCCYGSTGKFWVFASEIRPNGATPI